MGLRLATFKRILHQYPWRCLHKKGKNEGTKEPRQYLQSAKTNLVSRRSGNKDFQVDAICIPACKDGNKTSGSACNGILYPSKGEIGENKSGKKTKTHYTTLFIST